MSTVKLVPTTRLLIYNHIIEKTQQKVRIPRIQKKVSKQYEKVTFYSRTTTS